MRYQWYYEYFRIAHMQACYLWMGVWRTKFLAIMQNGYLRGMWYPQGYVWVRGYHLLLRYHAGYGIVDCWTKGIGSGCAPENASEVRCSEWFWLRQCVLVLVLALVQGVSHRTDPGSRRFEESIMLIALGWIDVADSLGIKAIRCSMMKMQEDRGETEEK